MLVELWGECGRQITIAKFKQRGSGHLWILFMSFSMWTMLLCTCSGALLMNGGWVNIVYHYSLPRVKNVEAHLPQTETFTEERRHVQYLFLPSFSADRKWRKTRLHSVTWPREILFLAQTCFQSLQIVTGLKGTVAREGFKDYIFCF